MSFNRTSLPPMVTLGGSTDVPASSAMSDTSMSPSALILKTIVLRTSQGAEAELQPLDADPNIPNRRSGRSKVQKVAY